LRLSHARADVATGPSRFGSEFEQPHTRRAHPATTTAPALQTRGAGFQPADFRRFPSASSRQTVGLDRGVASKVAQNPEEFC